MGGRALPPIAFIPALSWGLPYVGGLLDNVTYYVPLDTDVDFMLLPLLLKTPQEKAAFSFSVPSEVFTVGFLSGWMSTYMVQSHPGIHLLL